jgi:hypothetical protein
LALLIKPPQQLFIEPLFSSAHWLGRRALLPDYGANRVAAQGQAAGNLPHGHPFLVQ